MAKRGRPSVFTQDIVDTIFERMNLGESEYAVIKGLSLGWSTWCAFKAKQYGEGGSIEFQDSYTRAKENGLKCWENKILELSQDRSRDQQPYQKFSAKTGELIEDGTKSDNTAVNRDRLIVDSYKWIMAKMMPKIYGDKFQGELTGKDGGPLVAVIVEDGKKTA